MAQPSNLASLFADVNRFGQNEEWDKALKTANKILQEDKNEEKAFHCKIVSQIHLNKFDDALTAIHKNSLLSKELIFEKAYCEYRLNRTNDALKTLRSVEDPDENMKELLGQVLYRMEEHEECFEVYKDLVKNMQDEFEEERETNLSAVLAGLQGCTVEDVPDLGLRSDTYELCYNHATYLLEKHQYEAAAAELRRAETLCRQMFEEDPDATEDDIDQELMAIRVQLGYTLQRMGRNEEAMKLYNQVIKQKPSDIALAAVASNNIVTLNKEGNVFDSKKRIKVATADGLNQKLTGAQKEAIAINQCLLYMYMNQGDQCKKMAKNLHKTYPSIDTPSLIEAAQLVRDKQAPQAIQALQTQVSESSGNSLDLKLTLAQLYLTQGSVFQACDTLRSLGEYSYKPGVVSALVTLYLSQEDKESASEVLMSASQWYKDNNPDSDDLVQLMQANANYQMHHGDPSNATKVLEEIRRANPSDLKTLAQLISAYSKFDPKKAQALSAELPSAEELAQEVDVDALEASVSTLGPKYIKKATKTEHSPTKPTSPKSGDELVQKKKKKKKKGKMPKTYDLSVDPDQERWLPRKERSYFRGKRKDKRKDNVSKGTQGAAQGSAANEFDKSSPAPSGGGSEVGSPKPGATTPGASGGASSAPAQGAKKQQQAKGKKKKKGGKW